jgi:hypothetical protein
VAALAGLAVVSTPASQPVQASHGAPGRPQATVAPAVSLTDRAATERADAVGGLLRQRATAILQRDEPAFLATLDPHAAPEFVSAQRRLFANLGGVPLDEWSYAVHPQDTLDTAGLLTTASGAAIELWAPAVELRYALRGGDLVATYRPMGYLFARYGTEWYLRSDTALDGLGRRSWRGPWDFAPCLARATRYGVVLAHPGDEPMVERLVRELDSSVLAVSAVWGTGWSQRVTLVLAGSIAEMAALAGPDFPVESVVAVALADRVDTGQRTVAGQRVVLSPAASPGLSDAALRVVLRHEILHVAARAATMDGSPMWLLEGFADYVGYRDSGVTLPQAAPGLVDLVRREGPPRWLPDDRAFRAHGRALDLAYQQGWSVARFVAERYGEAVLVDLYRTLAAAGPATASEIDRLMRAILGVDRAGLVEGWQHYLRQAVS